MRLSIDTDKKTLTTTSVAGIETTMGLYTDEAFRLISEQWIKVGWNQKYSYGFSWMGRPAIQLPQDLIRMQEVIYRLKPDVIVETGIAHGGSVVFYASLCKAMGRGQVIGVDIDIRQHNWESLRNHELSDWFTLIEGDSIKVVDRVADEIYQWESVMVILDSAHGREHVLAELEAYSKLVTPHSYIVVADGIMADLHDVPNGSEGWVWDSPLMAIAEFLQKHDEFIAEGVNPPFKENTLDDVTYWPCAFLRRISG